MLGLTNQIPCYDNAGVNDMLTPISLTDPPSPFDGEGKANLPEVNLLACLPVGRGEVIN